MTETRTVGITSSCKECGHVNKYQHEFCVGCGASLKQIEADQSNVTVIDTKPELPTDSNNTLSCRVCGQPLQLLGLGEGFVGDRWYCYKDDQVWLADERKWAEQPQTKSTQTVKYCKKCGSQLELEDQFCDVCGGEQKKRKDVAPAASQSTNAVVPANQTPNVAVHDVPATHSKRTKVIAIATVIIIAVMILPVAITIRNYQRQQYIQQMQQDGYATILNNGVATYVSYESQPAQQTQVSQQTNQLQFTGVIVSGGCWSYGITPDDANSNIHVTTFSDGTCVPTDLTFGSGTVTFDGTAWCSQEKQCQFTINGETWCAEQTTSYGGCQFENSENMATFSEPITATGYCNGNAVVSQTSSEVSISVLCPD